MHCYSLDMLKKYIFHIDKKKNGNPMENMCNGIFFLRKNIKRKLTSTVYT